MAAAILPSVCVDRLGTGAGDYFRDSLFPRGISGRPWRECSKERSHLKNAWNLRWDCSKENGPNSTSSMLQ